MDKKREKTQRPRETKTRRRSLNAAKICDVQNLLAVWSWLNDKARALRGDIELFDRLLDDDGACRAFAEAVLRRSIPIGVAAAVEEIGRMPDLKRLYEMRTREHAKEMLAKRNTQIAELYAALAPFTNDRTRQPWRLWKEQSGDVLWKGQSGDAEGEVPVVSLTLEVVRKSENYRESLLCDNEAAVRHVNDAALAALKKLLQQIKAHAAHPSKFTDAVKGEAWEASAIKEVLETTWWACAIEVKVLDPKVATGPNEEWKRRVIDVVSDRSVQQKLYGTSKSKGHDQGPAKAAAQALGQLLGVSPSTATRLRKRYGGVIRRRRLTRSKSR